MPVMTTFTLFPTPLGDCAIAWRDESVTATQLPEVEPQATAARIAARTGASQEAPPRFIQEAICAITALLEGDRTDLNFIPCDFSGLDAFSVDVYKVTRAIPAGKTLTYGAIAEQLGEKQLSRSVGQALGRNPLPVIVPCHRVMGAGGKLTGFSATGGVTLKLKLLDIERANSSQTPGLFDGLPLSVKPNT